MVIFWLIVAVLVVIGLAGVAADHMDISGDEVVPWDRSTTVVLVVTVPLLIGMFAYAI